MNSKGLSKKVQELSETRLLGIVLGRLEGLEARSSAREHPADGDQRARDLRELHKLMSELAKRPDSPPFFAGLASQLEGEPELRQLTAITVAVERALDRRLRDEDFLPVTDRSDREARRMPVCVVADSLRSSFNIGGIFRSSECFGVSEIVLTGYSATPADHRVAKAAMGTDDDVPWKQVRKLCDIQEELRARGFQIVALESAALQQPLTAVQLDFPCAVLVGNERFGHLPKTLEQADRIWSIPTYGRKNSLNVVSAVSICLYELRRRWEAKAAKDC